MQRLLIVGNLALSVIALTYDWPALQAIPTYLWPLVAICPLYPLLLALYWLYTAGGKESPYLAAVAALPAATYGLLALVFYPLVMLKAGFTWNDTGQIVWVWLYAAQAFVILRRTVPQAMPAFLGLFWLFASLSVLYLSPITYFALDLFTHDERTALYLVAVILSFISLGFWAMSVPSRRA